VLIECGRAAHYLKGQGLEAELSWLLDGDRDTRVHVMCCDVSDEAQVLQLLSDVRVKCGGISGIVHAAGVLRDGLLRGGGAEAGCEAVWSAKALSGWWLHEHSLCDELSLFVCYSSITSSLGNPGQSVYGGSNSFLDHLMVHRVGLGLCGLSIQWPAILGVGMAAANGNVVEDDATSMLRGDAVKCIKHSVGVGSGTILSSICVMYPLGLHSLVSEAAIGKQFSSLKVPALLGAQRTATRNVNVNTGSGDKLEISSVVGIVTEAVLALLKDVESIEVDADLVDSGLDSLGTTELASQLSASVKIKLLPSLALKYPTIRDIAEHIVDKSSGRKASKGSKRSRRVQGNRLGSNQSSQSNDNDHDNDDFETEEGVVLDHCPLFSNYACRTPTMRIVLFSALGQPATSWYYFASYFMNHGIDAHIIHLPGRFERSDVSPYSDMDETVDGICDGMKQMGWLDSGNVPVVFLGFSYGTYVAYECIKRLQNNVYNPYTIFHLISIAGIGIEELRKFPALEDCEGDSMEEKLRVQFLATHGKEPPVLGHKGFSNIQGPMVEDIDICRGWMEKMESALISVSDADSDADSDSNMKDIQVDCDFTWTVGKSDATVPSRITGGFRDYTTGQFQRIVFPGDHFLVFQNADKDRVIAEECLRVVKRSLDCVEVK